MNDKLEMLLKELGVEVPQEITKENSYEILNKLADRWDIFRTNIDSMSVTIFNSLCKHSECQRCCCDCEERFDGCQHTCFTYKFDCDDCNRKFELE